MFSGDFEKRVTFLIKRADIAGSIISLFFIILFLVLSVDVIPRAEVTILPP